MGGIRTHGLVVVQLDRGIVVVGEFRGQLLHEQRLDGVGIVGLDGAQGLGRAGKLLTDGHPYAFGAAWLAKHIGFVKDAAAEMNALKGSNLKDSVAVQDTFKTQIAALPQWDSTASIKLQQYRNNDISYAVNTSGKPQFAVLSEIYYSRGWNAYADGKPVPIVKTNYVLRGVALPAGTQKLELKFEPESYKMGSNTTTITSAIVLVLLLLGLYMQYFRKRHTA